MKVPAARIVFSASDRAEIASQVSEALASGALTLGPHTRAFEEEFAAAHGAAHAVAMASGTAALEATLRAAGLTTGEVVVPTNTFFATAEAVVRAGARPVFADADAATLSVSVQTVEAVLTPETRAVVLVHIGGSVPADVVALAQLCADRGIALVEDAAHAHGSTYDGRHAGTFGLAGAFSFYPTKVITSGEGGMVLTADGDLAEELRTYRDQGKPGFTTNTHTREGYAWRMSELHAIVGRVHLRRLDEFLARRQEVAAAYDAALAEVPGITVASVPSAGRANYYKYPVLLPPGVDRTLLKKRLRDEFGVALSGEVYELPLHLQPVFQRFASGSLLVAEDVCARQVCLPVLSDMTDAEVQQVLDSFVTVLDEVDA